MKYKTANYQDIYNPHKTWKAVVNLEAGRYYLTQFIKGRRTAALVEVTRSQLFQTVYDWEVSE